MKSLEIVNELVSLTKNEIKVCLSEKNTSDLLVIKQDLEVLEIIRKKKVDIEFLKINYQGVSKGEWELEDLLFVYNTAHTMDKYLTMEELLKLKQWLEVNEYETNL